MEVFVEWSDDPYVKNGLPVILESALRVLERDHASRS